MNTRRSIRRRRVWFMALWGFTVIGRRRRRRRRCGGEAVGEEWHFRKFEDGLRVSLGFWGYFGHRILKVFLDLSICFSDGGVWTVVSSDCESNYFLLFMLFWYFYTTKSIRYVIIVFLIFFVNRRKERVQWMHSHDNLWDSIAPKYRSTTKLNEYDTNKLSSHPNRNCI